MIVALLKRDFLKQAIKKASRCGEPGKLTVADFDAATIGWSWKGDHLDILPLELQYALAKHDRENPKALLGGPPLDFGIEANLMLCVRGMYEMSQEILCEHLSTVVGKKVDPATFEEVVDHLKTLISDQARKDFVAKLVTAQKCIRAAAKETGLCLVSDETDCRRVMLKVNALGSDPAGVVERLAATKKEFKEAFEKHLKAAETRPKK